MLKRPTTRLVLEPLEDRSLPSTYTAVQAGNWTAPATWTGGPGPYPDSGDVAVIGLAAGSAVVLDTTLSGELLDLQVSGGTLDLQHPLATDQLEMSGGNVEADAAGDYLWISGLGAPLSTWTGGSIGVTTTKSTLMVSGVQLNIGGTAGPLGFDADFGFNDTAATVFYKAADQALDVTNDANITVEAGSKLNLNEDTGGSTVQQLGVATGTSVNSYLDVYGTVADNITNGDTFTLRMPTYVESGGELDVLSSTTNQGYLSVPVANPAGGKTQGYSVYQDGGTVFLSYGSLNGAILSTSAGMYQAGGEMDVSGSSAFKGGNTSGSGLYFGGTLKIDPTSDTTVLGKLTVFSGDVQFVTGGSFDFGLLKAGGGSHSTLAMTGSWDLVIDPFCSFDADNLDGLPPAGDSWTSIIAMNLGSLSGNFSNTQAPFTTHTAAYGWWLTT